MIQFGQIYVTHDVNAIHKIKKMRNQFTKRTSCASSAQFLLIASVSFSVSFAYTYVSSDVLCFNSDFITS